MPDPLMGGQVPQTAVADTPAQQDEQRTQTGSDQKDLMSFLDIPADVQEKLKPRAIEPELQGDVPTQPPQTPEPPPTAEEMPLQDEEAAEEAEETEEEQQPAAQAEVPRLDKRQKRINRLTRQKSELQGKLDATYAEREELRRQLTLYEQQQQQAVAGAAPGISRLAWITSEQQLAQEYSKAQGLMDWCDENREGVSIGSGEGEKYYDSETIAGWRRDAEKLVMTAPMRREELRQYGQTKNYYDDLVKQSWPDILDKSSPDYQAAVAVYKQYPGLVHLPQGLFVAGLLIEGAKSLDARNARNGQAPKQHRDIDERAFAPRVPLSPHVANPPTRTSTPSSKQRVTEAMSDLVKDTDGSQSSVAAAFAALDAARPQQRPQAKTPVRS